MDFTNATYSNENGQLILYTNGMSIHSGIDHEPIRGDTISYGPAWAANQSLTDIGTNEPRGFTISDGAVFMNKPGSDNEILVLYGNYDNSWTTGIKRREIRFGTIQVNGDGNRV